MKKQGKKRRAGRIALIVLAVLLVLAVGALTVAGNYLFHFALDPQAGGMVSREDPDARAWFTSRVTGMVVRC